MARRRRGSSTTKLSSGAVVEGLQDTLRAFGRLDKEAKKAARDRVQKISDVMAAEIKAAGRSRRDPRDRLVAQTIRSKNDALPVIKIGSAEKLQVTGRRRQSTLPRASDLMFGMEFGSNGQATDRPTRRGGRPGWRFPERTPRRGRGNEGYWIFPTARAQQSRVVDLWAQALEDVAVEWTR